MIHLTHRDLTGRQSWAEFSECERYRYTLGRHWGAGGLINWIMLNPSTADHRDNDPTIARCEERTERLGYGGLVVTNLFAFRATLPKEMIAATDPIGPDNDEAIRATASVAEMVICGWGNDGAHRSRGATVIKMLRELCPAKLHYLRLCKTGEPNHPLYLPYALMPIPWTITKAVCEATEGESRELSADQ